MANSIAYSTVTALGVATTFLLSDATLPYPTAIMSSANSSTLTLTDDATNMTLKNSLGVLNLDIPGIVFLTPTVASGARMNVNVDPDFNAYGIQSAWAGGAITGTPIGCWDARFSSMSGVWTNARISGFVSSLFTLSPTSGSGAGNKVYGVDLGNSFQINNTNASYDEVATGYFKGVRRLISSPTITVQAGVIIEPPTAATSDQVGLLIRQQTAQVTATNRYGVQIGGQNSGTNRYGMQIIGNVTGTPTLSIALDLLAHGVGTTKYSLQTGDPSNMAGIIMQDATDIALNANTGSKLGTAATQKLGFWNAAPVVQQTAAGVVLGYTANANLNNVFDATTFTGNTGATAYTIGDIVAALKTEGLIAA